MEIQVTPHEALSDVSGLDLFEFKVLVFIAGGIGVTPVISQVEHLSHVNTTDRFHKKIYVVWATSDPNQFDWFSSVLTDIQHQINDLFEVQLFNTQTNRSLQSDVSPLLSLKGQEELVTQVGKGRPDFKTLLQDIRQAQNDERIRMWTSRATKSRRNGMCRGSQAV